MQLDLLFRTLFANCDDIKNISDINVLYKAEESHRESYEILKKDYPDVNFVEEKSFKNDLLGFFPDKTSVLFLCDDSVSTEKFSLKQVIKDLESDNNCIGFSLRLGKNTHKCYPYNDAPQVVPDMTKLKKDNSVNSYQWKPAQLDFSYALEISSSAYRVEDVLPLLEACDYDCPNKLESILAENLDMFALDRPLLMCFDKSVMFSNPINRVQTFNQNRSGNTSEVELMQQFMNGYRMDSSIFSHYNNSGAHEIVDCPLVKLVQNE